MLKTDVKGVKISLPSLWNDSGLCHEAHFDKLLLCLKLSCLNHLYGIARHWKTNHTHTVCTQNRNKILFWDFPTSPAVHFCIIIINIDNQLFFVLHHPIVKLKHKKKVLHILISSGSVVSVNIRKTYLRCQKGLYQL